MKVRLLRCTENGVELVAKSARVSGVPADMTDEEILRMIVENDYSSALEHISFSFDVSEISVALSRELLEHRIASHTARSTRYQEEIDFGYYIPKEFERKPEAKARYEETMRKLAETYAELRGMGVSRESSRYLLPMAAHTNYIWTINARSLINFLGLRLCVRASPEMRELARKVHEIAVEKYPVVFDNIDCRGWNMAVCPENKVRENTRPACPYKKKIPTKEGIRRERAGI
ncbi:MAG: FAD-dependent thymidylate synthase [Candidatus Hydrothermarchaeaceae archaeon]